MKNIILVCCIFGLNLIFQSCYDDDSTLPKIHYPDLVIKKTAAESQGYLTAQYTKDFIFSPDICQLLQHDTIPLNEEELEQYAYHWKLTFLTDGKDTAFQTIGNERVLNTVITSSPVSGNENYTLVLNMMHRSSGVMAEFSWKLKILGTYGPGLLIAETGDEQTTDLALIMSVSYNNDIAGYEDDQEYHHILQQIGEAPVEGVVSSLSFLAYNLKAVCTVVEGKSVIHFDPVSMKRTGENGDLFYYAPEVLNPQSTFTDMYYGLPTSGYLINEGRIHCFTQAKGTRYTYASDAKYKLAKVFVPGSNPGLYDLAGGRFVRFNNNNGIIEYQNDTEHAFNPADAPGIEPVFADLANYKDTDRWLIRKEGKYFVYDVHGSQGRSIFDLSNCTDIDKASCYAFSENFDEFYYAVDNHLYVSILNADSPTSTITYDKFDSREKITHLLIHKGNNGRTTWSESVNGSTGESEPFWRKSQNNLLSVVTYNEQTREGRVYTLPIQYAGSGGIAPEKYVRCYKNFDRITAITMRD